MGSMAEEGVSASSGSGSSGNTARPGWGLGPAGEGGEGQAERVERKRTAPSTTEGRRNETAELPAPPLGPTAPQT